jgi:hypothetical protein
MATTTKPVKRFELTPETAAGLQSLMESAHITAAEKQALADFKEFLRQGHAVKSKKIEKEIGIHMGALLDMTMRLHKLSEQE